MGINMEYSAGFMVGFLIAVLGAVLIVYIIRRKLGGCCGKYDERQLLARGKAFKYGFFTIICYFGVVCMLQLATEARPWEDYVVNYLGVVLGIAVFATNAIWSDAYISFQERAGTYMVLLSAGGLANFGCAFLPSLVGGEALKPSWLNLLSGIMAMYVVLVFGIKRLRDKKQEEE